MRILVFLCPEKVVKYCLDFGNKQFITMAYLIAQIKCNDSPRYKQLFLDNALNLTISITSIAQQNMVSAFHTERITWSDGAMVWQRVHKTTDRQKSQR